MTVVNSGLLMSICHTWNVSITILHINTHIIVVVMALLRPVAMAKTNIATVRAVVDTSMLTSSGNIDPKPSALKP